MSRSIATGAVLVLIAAGCTGVAEAPPPPAPEPEEEVAPEPPAPVEPEPTLEERWAAPFAVLSSGRTAPRLVRPVVEAPEMEEGQGAVAGADTLAGASRADSLPTDPAREVTIAGESEEAEQAGGAGKDEEVRDAEEAEATSGAARTHRVERGETWLGLARRFGVSTAALAALNPDVDPERLRAGEVLLLPARRAEASAQRTHTVVAGDSLWGISRRYGVSIERLQEVNRLEGDRVRIGQVLIIP